ncbi:minor capsid protein [uncultured Clostridium sp.]|uniref:minor capsid protein n=1 Tax=uncultured Clostridium sp. TaxID=59620 RepID=UPI00262B962C|nr:minor capsid protein [uncultured Clostridium sp.]
MATKVTINFDPTEKVLLKRNLNNNGQAQYFFTNEVARLSEPYIPFQDGDLKNKKLIGNNKITYNMPYAKKQYFTNSGNGKEGSSKGGLRGKLWVKRCWSDHGKDICKSVARFVGGSSE